MIIQCPHCNRRFDLQRRPPQIFKCPKCGFTTDFREVLDQSGPPSPPTVDDEETTAATQPGTASTSPGLSAPLSQPTQSVAPAEKTQLVPGMGAPGGMKTEFVASLHPTKRAVLQVYMQGKPIGTIQLPAQGNFNLGRSSSDSTAQVKVAPDITMSRLHAGMRVVMAGGVQAYQITSVKNENPVYVNGAPVRRGQAVTLKSGDKLRLGNTEAIFKLV